MVTVGVWDLGGSPASHTVSCRQALGAKSWSGERAQGFQPLPYVITLQLRCPPLPPARRFLQGADAVLVCWAAGSRSGWDAVKAWVSRLHSRTSSTGDMHAAKPQQSCCNSCTASRRWPQPAAKRRRLESTWWRQRWMPCCHAASSSSNCCCCSSSSTSTSTSSSSSSSSSRRWRMVKDGSRRPRRRRSQTSSSSSSRRRRRCRSVWSAGRRGRSRRQRRESRGWRAQRRAAPKTQSLTPQLVCIVHLETF